MTSTENSCKKGCCKWIRHEQQASNHEIILQNTEYRTISNWGLDP